MSGGWKLASMLIGLTVAVVLSAFIVEWAWNGVISTTFGIGELTWLKSVQLSVLVHSLNYRYKG